MKYHLPAPEIIEEYQEFKKIQRERAELDRRLKALKHKKTVQTWDRTKPSIRLEIPVDLAVQISEILDKRSNKSVNSLINHLICEYFKAKS